MCLVEDSKPLFLLNLQTQTRAFDTEAATSSYATGFVVDKTLGLILTNRHVISPSPIVAEAVFQNREEVPVHPLYYDPVHDFGFFRFDPKSLKFMSAEEVPLAPEAAAVGLDIKVVGNDSNERLSILASTLARLDRDAPHYTRKGFNDFNTFYLQAASGTKGGSSGSPVVDIHGRAVALNAGGKNKAASAYYLPLNRVVRALDILRSSFTYSPPPSVQWQAPVIPRGDLQATFLFKGFDEVKRLGLTSKTEAQVRAAQAAHFHSNNGVTVLVSASTGMLVVDSIVQGGPSDGYLEPGDVLIKLDGQYVSDFLTMEELFDSKVAQLQVTNNKKAAAADVGSSLNGGASASTNGGGCDDGDDEEYSTVSVEIERGGNSIQATIRIQDLHAVTPARFLEIGGGVVNSLSYQQARNFRTPVHQVYVAEPGYLLGKAGCPKHCIITAVAGQQTKSLDEFINIILKLEHGQRIPLEYFTFDDRNRKKQTILHVDWVWYATPIEWVKDNAQGLFRQKTLWPESLKEKEIATTVATTASSSLHGSPRGIASPCIQATCAGRPPRPPTSSATPEQDTSEQQQQHLLSPLPLSIPRQHSVPEVATSHELEKCQAGVTGQAEDGRLLVLNQKTEVENEKIIIAAAAEDEGEEWRTRLEERLRAAMVAVDIEIPLVGLLDGVHSRAFTGTGIIVHISKNLGIVIVDRNTAAIGLGDIMLSLGAYPAEIPGKVRFLHPLHNFGLISFSLSDLSAEAAAAIAPVELKASPPLRRGETVELVSLSKSLRILHRTSVVTTALMAVNINPADVPRFRAVHEEVIKLDQDFGLSYSGVLCDRNGAIRALWGSYSEQVDGEDSEWTAGLATAVFQPWVDALISRLDEDGVGLPPSIRVLNAELEPLLLSKAAQFGLPSEWISRLMDLDKERRQALRVRSTVAGSHAREVLHDGDIVLAVNGEPVSCFGHVEKIILELDGGNNSSSKNVVAASDPLLLLPLTIFRGGQVLNVTVNLGIEDGLGTDRVVHWAGAQLQAPHRAVLECGFAPKEASGVYISRWHHGSPAHRFGLYALHWITEVNGEKVPDLDTFLALVNKLKDGDAVRLKVQHYETMRVKVMTLKIDTRYWPTWQLRLDAARGEWSRVDI